jgi:L,D-transpeptidase-like protein
MGRSYGCPAVPRDVCEEIIDMIKDGTCLFIYHPTKKYIQRSRILNG